MSRNAIEISAELSQYLVSHSAPPDGITRDLIAETHEVLPEQAGMQIGPEQSAFMWILTQIVGVRNAIEIGTFTGMSSLAVARGMPPDGKLTCLDVSTEYTDIARRYWERAKVADRVELRIGDARHYLRELTQEPHLDLAFLDADKGGYVEYWDALVPRVRAGGVILADNTLWRGRVVDDSDQSEQVNHIRRFNDHAAGDERMDVVLLPIGDGLTLGRKK